MIKCKLTDGMTEEYRNAEPFPHIAINNFLDDQTVDILDKRFPKRFKIQYDRRQENRKRTYAPDNLKSHTLKGIFADFNSKSFLEFLEGLTGIDGLIPDPYFVGGGFHETLPGGHLGIHADFTVHKKLNLERRVNVLIYLNREWFDLWGGRLELWYSDMSRKAISFTPIWNCCVIFNTSETSFHGHPEPLECPEGMTRRSVALYYYTAPKINLKSKTTAFRRRKGTDDKIDLRAKLVDLVNDFVPPILMRRLR